LVWGYLLTSWGYQYLDRKIHEQHASYHYQPARNETQPARPLLGQPKARQYNPSCQAPVNREDSDLCAQWSAVEAVNESNGLATINLWLSVITVLMTATGTSLLLWTLWETRQTARRELRAYVSVKRVVVDRVDEDGFHGAIEIINLGATPATIAEVAYRAWIVPSPTADPVTIGPKPVVQALAPKVMGKDHPETIRVWVVPKDKPQIGKLMKDLHSQKWEACIYGWVIYHDIFGTRHRTLFAYTSPRYYLTKGDVFLPCIGGNDTD
jgi:hypothetical protein